MQRIFYPKQMQRILKTQYVLSKKLRLKRKKTKKIRKDLEKFKESITTEAIIDDKISRKIQKIKEREKHKRNKIFTNSENIASHSNVRSSRRRGVKVEKVKLLLVR